MKLTISHLALLAATGLAVAPFSAPAKDSLATAKPNPNLDLARQLNQAFVEVADEVSPAVVVITVTQKATPSSKLSSGQGLDDGEDPLDRVPPELRRFFRHRSEEAPPEPTRGQGSGIIIRDDGYILTNRHVVEDAEKIEVRLKDGRIFKAEVRGVDAPSDVAVVKIDAKDLPVAKLADSNKTRVGEFAIAIGAPFALDYSVTFGHVSAKDRSNILQPDPEGPTMTDQNFIQTDANINPGNSGGPLININGEVIGINTLIRGLHTGIGFAIPSNLAREVADKLITDGKFTRAWLGIGIRSLREYPEFRELVPTLKDGVVVDSIVPNGPAAKSELHPADVITAIDGKPVITSQQLKDEIRSKRIGQDMNLDVFREGKDGKGRQVKVVVKPGEFQDKTLASNNTQGGAALGSSANGSLGVTVKALTRDLAEQFNVDVTDGVIVTAVDKTGLAARNDIKPGDIITSVNQQPVANPKQFRDALKSIDVKKGVIVNLVSDGTAKFEILKEGSE
jgi:serine protease Do